MLDRPAPSSGEVLFSGDVSGVGFPAAKVVAFDELGLRRCLCRYEADDTERGIPGLEAGPVIVFSFCWPLF